MLTKQPLLTLQQVSRSFTVGEQTVSVLDKISFTVNAGEMLAIMGASGSGKSTLMNLLGCLDRPTSGSYQIAGQDTAKASPEQLAALRRERFGFIFQRYHLLPQLTAWQNVALAACYADVPASVRQPQAQTLLTQLGLADRWHYRPAKLSGGQQQRVSIARALINGGQIILADEPTGALDSQSSELIMAILHQLHQQGHTIIIVTHDAKIAAQTQRVITLQDGQLRVDQTNIPERSLNTQETSTFLIQQPPASASRWLAWANHSYEMLRMAWLTLITQKLRSSLTLLSLVIGIASVVSSIAVSHGLKESMLKDFRDFAANKMDIVPGKQRGDQTSTHRRSLTPRDLPILQQQPFIKTLSPVITGYSTLRSGHTTLQAFVYGVNSSYFTIENVNLLQGSLLTPEQVANQAAVVVIDRELEQQLFPKQLPDQSSNLGKILLVGNIPLQIIGITEKPSFFGQSLVIWIPYTTATVKLLNRSHFSYIALFIQENYHSLSVEQAITELLTLHHGKKDFWVANFDQRLKIQQNIFKKLQRFLLLVALVTLAVGGLGIMNILLVSVSERVREIGIRLAIGARQRDIQQQFLLEAVVICALGGLGGIVLSLIIITLVQWLNPTWPITLTPTVIVSAVTGAHAIGLAAGYLPARRASQLDPVAALTVES